MRRVIAAILAVATLVGVVISNPDSYDRIFGSTTHEASADSQQINAESQDIEARGTESQGSGTQNIQAQDSSAASTESDVVLATEILVKLEIKGRAPKTGYTREEFYSGWPKIDGCNLRQRILKRELGETAQLADDQCTVLSGEFDEPYTGQHLAFTEKSEISKGLQIDHVVALSDAWQKGAQYLSKEIRYQIATDPLNLLAVDSQANQGKSDGDAATWLPKNKAFRCQYVARQISVKYKYTLWVTQAEHNAMARILEACPSEPAVGVEGR